MVQSTVQTKGDVVVITPMGEITRINRLNDLPQKVDIYLARDFRRFILDFSNTTAIDSPGLGIIFSIYKKVIQEHGALVGCCVPDRLKRVFEVMSFRSVIQTSESLDEAIGLLPPRAN